MSDGADHEPPPASREAAPVPALRASDADRERVADQPREASGEGRLTVDELDERLDDCYAARTVPELARLTVDIIPGAQTAFTADSSQPVSVRSGPGGTGTIVSIMGGNDRKGRWRVASRLNVVNVMGGHDVRLSDSPPPPGAPVIRLRMLSIMGGGDVRQGRKLSKAERRLKQAREHDELRGT